jgi:uroporphyrinogen-III synthase
LKVKSILVTQPKPETEKSPYFDLAEKYKLKIDFRTFIHVEGLGAQEFRQSRINIPDYDAVIMTSRNAVDHFFRLCVEMRVKVPESLKYFCLSEATAYYLQKYVVYRKRKIFFGRLTIHDLIDQIVKHRENKFLIPCSDILKPSIPDVLTKNKIDFTTASFYKTVCSDLQDLSDVNYDVLVFFSPADIKSLYQNFPDFKQNNTRIACFGPTTIKAAETAGLDVNIKAPTPELPSMTMAIQHYIDNLKL